VRVWVSQFARALLAIVLLLAPLAAHLAFLWHRGFALAVVLVGGQAAIISWAALSPIARRSLRASACLVVFLLVLWLSQFTECGPIIASVVPHAMAYSTLLTVFAVSLAPGRESVATVFARRVRGHLPADIVRYTRRVTWAWCWFFLAQLLASLFLLLFAPLDIWSWFINLCSLPLIGVMFCAEYAYRQWRHAAQPPERLVDIVRIFREIRSADQ